MKGVSQNYSYANNSSGELINVSIAQHSEKYYCPVCGELMVPHMGKVRRWHFVHKNTGYCSYESYIHKLAKIRIRQLFLSSEHFLLSYKAKALCSFSCPFTNSPKCESEKPVEFDLRKYYDECEMEVPYHKYKADLLLKSSMHPNRPPVLIEIMVTHKCTEDKICDGVRIIEIPVHSEEDIDNIVNNRKLKAVRYDKINDTLSKERNITLYNFNKVESFDPIGHFDDLWDCFNRKNTIVFYLNRKGYFKSFDCYCYEVSKKLPQNVHYFITNIATPFKEIFQVFSKYGVKICNCFLCKFSKITPYGDRLCVLYKKYNLPRKPSPYSAISCSHYREDFEFSKNVTRMVHPLSEKDSEDSTEHKFYYHICKEIL